jgi:hypothetical protein
MLTKVCYCSADEGVGISFRIAWVSSAEFYHISHGGICDDEGPCKTLSFSVTKEPSSFNIVDQIGNVPVIPAHDSIEMLRESGIEGAANETSIVERLAVQRLM